MYLYYTDFIRSDTTCIGITFGGGFVYTEEPLTRTRFIIISFAPFIAISLILPFILGMLHLLSPLILWSHGIELPGIFSGYVDRTACAYAGPLQGTSCCKRQGYVLET